MATGDLALYEPGSRVDVVVEADATGHVPQRGEAVEIVGATRGRVHVSSLTDAANFVGSLARTPTEYDEHEEYEAEDVVGESALLLRHYVDWLEAADVSTLSGGDLVVADADGVRAYDADPGDDEPHHIVGPVWATQGNAAGTKDKAAVVRHR